MDQINTRLRVVGDACHLVVKVKIKKININGPHIIAKA